MKASRLVIYRWRRAIVLLFCLGCLLILPGCWVYSVNPLYESAFFHPRDKDIVFDPGLIGSWQIFAEDCVTTLVITSTTQAQYGLTVKSKGMKCSDEDKKEVRFEGTLVKLDSHTFLDVSPDTEDICSPCLELHQIFLVALSKGALDMTPIDSEWLKDAVEKKKVDVATVSGNTDILTGSSKELKEFCRKYADDRTVFKPEPAFSFKRTET